MPLINHISQAQIILYASSKDISLLLNPYSIFQSRLLKNEHPEKDTKKKGNQFTG